jgi:predicted dehydrogenase
MEKVRTAVVGVGYLGRFHAQKHKLLDSTELVGVFDVHGESAEQVAKELDVKVFSSLEDVADSVEAVTIAASTKEHYRLSQFFLEKGKHILVEKPMTETVEQANELVALAKEKGLVFQVGHVERFNPALLSAQEKIGAPMFIEVHRLAPFKPRGIDVDVVLDLMIHDLDVTLSLVKSEVKEVSAVGVPVLTKLVDIANVRLEFESGAIANITASRVSLNSTRKFRVFQKDLYCSIDFGSGDVNLTWKTGDWDPEGEPPLDTQAWSLEKSDALLAETKSFIECIQNRRRPLVSGEDGMRALELAERIREQIYQRIN